MAAISRATMCLSGSHAGVSIGEDGPSQMALEDIAMMRAVHGSTVLHPCDANQTAKLVAAMAELDGISYIRTLRPATPVLYGPDEEFEVGGSRVLRSSDDDAVDDRRRRHHRARGAEGGRRARRRRHLDPRRSTATRSSRSTRRRLSTAGERIVTVEDHWPEGGLGDAVLGALAEAGVSARVKKLAVTDMPRSGKPAELMKAAGIDAEAIAAAVRELL